MGHAYQTSCNDNAAFTICWAFPPVFLHLVLTVDITGVIVPCRQDCQVQKKEQGLKGNRAELGNLEPNLLAQSYLLG